jgi:hypothetical protein
MNIEKVSIRRVLFPLPIVTLRSFSATTGNVLGDRSSSTGCSRMDATRISRGGGGGSWHSVGIRLTVCNDVTSRVTGLPVP